MIKINLQIIQPIIPSYRIPLFDILDDNERYNVVIFASRTNSNGVKSTSILRDYITIEGEISGFFGNRLVWQKGVRLLDEMKKGDVLVLCGNPRILSNYPLFFRARKRGVRIVWWGHGWSASSKRLTAWVRRNIMRMADVWLLYTDKEVFEYIKYGFDGGKLFAINNAIDHKQVDRAINHWSNYKLALFKNNNGIDGKKLLIFCGRLAEKAKLGQLITALADFLVDDNVVLAVIGSGEKEKVLKKYAVEKNVEKRIIWLGSMYDEEKIAPWFMSSICFIYPGSIGLSLLHAFCYSLPVITHNNIKRQMPEIAALEDRLNGLLFSEGDVNDLSSKIEYLLDNPKKQSLMSSYANETVKIKYNMTNMAARFTSAIEAAASVK